MDPVSSAEVYTIGHSNRKIDEFISLLKHHEVDCLNDVRSYPKSDRFPHFSRRELKDHLAKETIQYDHMPELGGLRDRERLSGKNTALSEGFEAVADYLNDESGQTALDALQAELENRSSSGNTVIMCAEKDYRGCHRRLVSDHLLMRGFEVLHILTQSETVPHELHPNARTGEKRVTYPGLV